MGFSQEANFAPLNNSFKDFFFFYNFSSINLLQMIQWQIVSLENEFESYKIKKLICLQQRKKMYEARKINLQIVSLDDYT